MVWGGSSGVLSWVVPGVGPDLPGKAGFAEAQLDAARRWWSATCWKRKSEREQSAAKRQDLVKEEGER